MPTPFTPPIPLLTGYGIQSGDAVIRTDMESGAARARQRTRSAPQRHSLRYRIKAADFPHWEGYWRDVMLQGAAWVSLSVFDTLTGAVAQRECRAISGYKADPERSALVWTIDVPVEVR